MDSSASATASAASTPGPGPSALKGWPFQTRQAVVGLDIAGRRAHLGYRRGGNADGRLEVFARGTDDALWHKWQIGAQQRFSGWFSQGGVLT